MNPSFLIQEGGIPTLTTIKMEGLKPHHRHDGGDVQPRSLLVVAGFESPLLGSGGVGTPPSCWWWGLNPSFLLVVGFESILLGGGGMCIPPSWQWWGLDQSCLVVVGLGFILLAGDGV